MYLSILRYIIGSNSKRGFTDLNKYAEDFFCPILNRVYGWDLSNQNHVKMNFPSIDLAGSKIAVQVTSKDGSSKIKSTLKKFKENGFHNKYDEIYIFLLSSKQNYRRSTYIHVGGIEFDVAKHVFDIDDLIKKIEMRSASDSGLLAYLEDYLERNLESIKTILTNESSLLRNYEKSEGIRAEHLKNYAEIMDLKDEDIFYELCDLQDLHRQLNSLSRETREIIHMMIGIANEEMVFNRSDLEFSIFDGDEARMRKFLDLFYSRGFIGQGSFDGETIEWIGNKTKHNMLELVKSFGLELENIGVGIIHEDFIKQVIIENNFILFDEMTDKNGNFKIGKTYC